jgi:hypothetical protein
VTVVLVVVAVEDTVVPAGLVPPATAVLVIAVPASTSAWVEV